MVEKIHFLIQKTIGQIAICDDHIQLQRRQCGYSPLLLQNMDLFLPLISVKLNIYRWGKLILILLIHNIFKLIFKICIFTLENNIICSMNDKMPEWEFRVVLISTFHHLNSFFFSKYIEKVSSDAHSSNN